MQELDKKAVRILMRTYWTSHGWRAEEERGIDAADLAYGKSKGILFDPLSLTHDECLKRLMAAAAAADPQALAAAFLASLSAWRPDLRSALVSYTYARGLTPHGFAPRKVSPGHSPMPYACEHCFQAAREMSGHLTYKNVDLNVLNFERLKWGGIRHNQILYCMFDLEQFNQLDTFQPTPDDTAIFYQILHMIDSCAKTDGPNQLLQHLKGVFPATEQERRVFIDALYVLDILRVLDPARPYRGGGKHDWSGVVDWRGEDSYQRDVVNRLFGAFISL